MSFKYKCRGCRIQEQCIEDSGLARGAKEMIRNAFSARTDTLSTWGVLQRNCLLVKEDEEHERRAKEGSLLSKRLQEARTAETDSEPEATPEPDNSGLDTQAQVSVMIGSASAEHTPPATNKLDSPADDSTSTDALARKKMAEKSQGDSRPLGTQALTTAELGSSLQGQSITPHWLLIADSQRRISLPLSGELVLGRFDPYNQEPLDIDLTFEDRENLMISRRHAKISAAEGYHAIEDLGSSNGLSVNGVLILVGQRHRLQPGDRISVGGILMTYEPVPIDLFGQLAIKGKAVRHLIYLTHRGHKVEIRPPNNVMIGRADPEANFMPTLDLSKDGEVATYVSRRHAIITWSEQTPLFKDLGSTFGTRINGSPLPPNQAFPLKPGDHMSLGGYVLAYDVDL